MPTLTVEGFTPVDVPSGKRLVLAIEQDAGVDILHACGGNARCTTCRIEFTSGEPRAMAIAEKTRLAERGLTGTPIWRLVDQAVDVYVQALPESERKLLSGVRLRRASLANGKKGRT